MLYIYLQYCSAIFLYPMLNACFNSSHVDKIFNYQLGFLLCVFTIQ
jgi:hypothetical protein